jgi:hypothetical protein
MIKSKFKILSYSRVNLIFILLVDLILLIVFINSLQEGPIYEDKISVYLFVFIFLIFFNSIIIIQYIVTNPKWVYENGLLTIYYWDKSKHVINIENASISVCGLKQIPFLFGMKANRDSLSFVVKNKTIYLPIDNYSNIIDLQKAILIHTKKLSKGDFIVHNCKYDEILITRKFNKWGIFVFHGLVLFIFIIPVLILTIENFSTTMFLILIALFILLLFISGYYTNYICLTDKHLIVKNNIFFWKNDIFLKSDIRNIYFKTPSWRGNRGPSKLFITLRDFKKKAYYVESIGTDNLSIIASELEKTGTKTQGIH